VAITYEELSGSGEQTITAKNKTALYRYIVRGSDDATAIVSHLKANLPTTRTIDGGTYGIIEIRATPEEGHTHWLADVTYGSVTFGGSTVPPTSGTEESFDTTGGTTRIYQSITTVNVESTLAAVPLFAGAIGLDSEGNAEGVDIVTPRYTFELRKTFAAATVNSAFKKNIATLTGKVNDATFKGFDAGEVLFMGARGTQNPTDGVWDIAFSFAVSPNQTGVTVGSIPTFDKKGWDYLWVQYAPTPDGSSNRMNLTPESAIVEQVYEYADFSTLGV
jgi:hypothetical protein